VQRVVLAGMAAVVVDADQQLGQHPGDQELQPAHHAEEAQRQQRPPADGLTQQLEHRQIAQDGRAQAAHAQAHRTEEVAGREPKFMKK
jgi:hypothetical protein